MPAATRPPAPRPPDRATPGAALVRAIARLVPLHLRDDWAAEWCGELDYYWTARQSTRAALLWRCLGALPDAFWLRRRHGGHLMLGQDLRFALRTFGRRPGFAAVVILTLALGIGANTAIFSVVNAVLLRSLPFPDPDRLVMLWGMATDGDSSKVARWSSYLDFTDIRSQARSFEQMAALRASRVALTGGAQEPARLDGAEVTANLFRALGAAPALGRGFLPEDERPGATRVVVLSDALWRGRFGGDPALIGRPVVLDGNAHVVVGVMGGDYAYPGDAQLWLPLVPGELDRERGGHTLRVVARLAPGVARASAETEVRGIARGLEAQYPRDNAKRGARLEPMREAAVGTVRATLLVLLGAVGVVLLIGCANVANLFLARAASREREVAVRTALGAGRSRLLRQFLAESLLLSLTGGALGLLFAHWALRAMLAAAPTSIPRADGITIDATVLAFLLGVSTIVGAVFGVLPALQLSRTDALGAFRDAGRGLTAGLGRRRLRQALVVSEVALAMLLVIGAALLVKSFWRLQRVDPGFEPRGLLAVRVQLPASRYAERPRVRRFYEELAARARATPGVRSASVAFEHPLSEGWTTSFTVEGRDPPREGEEPEARMRPVMPGYFRTVGVSLLRGRDIAERDRAEAPGVVVINESFARRHFPNEDPVGKRLRRQAWWPEMPTSYEIVGVVRDEKFLGPRGGADPATYFAFEHFPFTDAYLMVRTAGDEAVVAAALRREIRTLDADLPVEAMRGMQQILAESVAAPRFTMALIALFAVLALVLAAVGIYGVLSYTVARRTGEIGLRMALGAGRGRVLRLVVGQGMSLTLLGVAAGGAAALVATRALRTLLFGVSATDPVVFVGVALLLGSVAFVAAYVPARRASRVDPMVALRSE
ncbi:MAG: ABC transporter permease [Gemmatimonadaceae bacterium]